MNKIIFLFLIGISLTTCNKKKEQVSIVGTWKLVYGETKEKDSITVKNLSKTDFIKIINQDHFAFFNQPKTSSEGFYAGGGSYTLEGNVYKETLSYIGYDAFRGRVFPFTIEIVGDTLIQYGKEEIKEADINRDIIEKYIRIK